jgi:hypothetical protein
VVSSGVGIGAGGFDESIEVVTGLRLCDRWRDVYPFE